MCRVVWPEVSSGPATLRMAQALEPAHTPDPQPVCTRQNQRHPWDASCSKATQISVSEAPLKRLQACLLAETLGLWAGSANPNKG